MEITAFFLHAIVKDPSLSVVVPVLPVMLIDAPCNGAFVVASNTFPLMLFCADTDIPTNISKTKIIRFIYSVFTYKKYRRPYQGPLTLLLSGDLKSGCKMAGWRRLDTDNTVSKNVFTGYNPLMNGYSKKNGDVIRI